MKKFLIFFLCFFGTTLADTPLQSPKFISNIDISPDGKEIVYNVMDLSETHPLVQTWKGTINNPSSHQPLTTVFAIAPRWSPDGTSIAFLSRTNGISNLFLIELSSGITTQITNEKEKIETFAWSPDGQTIAFVKKEPNHPLPKNGIQIFPHRNTSSRLFLVNAEPHLQEPTPLTPPEYYVIGDADFGIPTEGFDWSPDSQTIAFTYSPEAGQESRWKHSQIALIDIHSKQVENIPSEGAHQSIPKFSPDGKTIALIQSPPSNSFTMAFSLVLFDLESYEFSQLAKTHDEAPFLVGPSLLGWTPDGSSILLYEPCRTKMSLLQIPTNGDPVQRFDNNKYFIEHPRLSRNRQQLVMTQQSPSIATEIFITTTTDFSPKKLTHINDDLKTQKMPKTKVISWKSYDGTTIEGLLTLPSNYTKGKKYPLLLQIHGGPMGAFFENYIGKTYVYPQAAFAQRGAALLRPNPRGSCGYGRKFREALLRNWGESDYEDLMSGVDFLIKKGLVDETRMGVMGASYGGYMTARIITKTNRFAAASMRSGLSNLTSMAYTTDLHSFIPDYLQANVWEDPAIYIKQSPLFQADKVKTPLLIQHGAEDSRVPLSQSIEFYHALKIVGSPATLVIYPGVDHHFSDLNLMEDFYQRNLDWFTEKLLK